MINFNLSKFGTAFFAILNVFKLINIIFIKQKLGSVSI